MEGIDVQDIVRRAVEEFARQDQAKSEPAYKAELQEERKRREHLEQRMNELVAENQRAHKVAEEAERSSAIKAELQRLGVAKIDLAFRAVQDGIARSNDGQFVARTESGERSMKEHLTTFVTENPEFLPARIVGGSGMTSTQKAPVTGREVFDLDDIRPGMKQEELQKIREEIVRVAARGVRGL
jgi:hypothetical protein